MTYALKDINPDYAVKGIKAGDALRRAAEVVEACAISDHTDDLIVLWARAIERRAMGTAHTDEVDALARMTAR